MCESLDAEIEDLEANDFFVFDLDRDGANGKEMGIYALRFFDKEDLIRELERREDRDIVVTYTQSWDNWQLHIDDKGSLGGNAHASNTFGKGPETFIQIHGRGRPPRE